MTKRRIAILGSTGSIGRQALDVISRHPECFSVAGLAAGGNSSLLHEQARRFGVETVSLRDEDGPRGLLRVALDSRPDLILAATDGFASFEAVFAAVRRGTNVAVANKELIVAAGEPLLAAAAESGSKILPVDSEHSALFQCLVGEPPERVARLILTASGGPFWGKSPAEVASATVSEALAHPTWQMGVKNTIDSATLMNKGLEVIEASRFFEMAGERIDVLVHRTSIAHGFVVFTDGSVKGQLCPPDMRVPIGYALAYPDRLDDDARGNNPAGADALEALGAAADANAFSLTFERPQAERFPCLALAYEALRRGGTAPAILSAANEVAVGGFVSGRIRFGEISSVVTATLEAISVEAPSLPEIRAADLRARSVAEGLLVCV